MPIRPENRDKYPKNWDEITAEIRARANNRCEFCGVANHSIYPITHSKVVLTVAHLDHNPSNCDRANLRALCQKCHNRYDAKNRIENMKKRKKLISLTHANSIQQKGKSCGRK